MSLGEDLEGIGKVNISENLYEALILNTNKQHLHWILFCQINSILYYELSVVKSFKRNDFVHISKQSYSLHDSIANPFSGMWFT